MVVSEIMTPAPYTIDVTQTAREAMLQLTLADIRHLPVLDEGVLVGMISDRDLRGLAAQVLTGSELSDMLDLPVAEIMSSDVLTVAPEADVAEVIELMLEYKIGALPVVSDSQLLGVVSYVDVLREAQLAL
jgi:CBS domain-containing protein